MTSLSGLYRPFTNQRARLKLMTTTFTVRTAFDPAPSPARVAAPDRAPWRLGLVQLAWDPDAAALRAALAAGVGLAAEQGAALVCLPELTLSPYFAIAPDGAAALGCAPESLVDGPTRTMAAEFAAAHGVYVHASLFEATPEITDGRGYNTAICVAPDGTLVAATRKTHIPVTAGYYEDRSFVGGDSGFPVYDISAAHVGFPTCWDQWFPELARAYSLAGADVIVYPTAIGSEPDHPGFDTEPLWQQVIVGNGIANGTFMVTINRIGTESMDGTSITFYGSSFISDPYGRILVQAPRDEPAVLVADLDLSARRDWLDLFPFLTTRRPDQYGPLT
jgi:N-carbamoylputrescine amidase